jgi:CDP-glycerol glycerophosphotransferase
MTLGRSLDRAARFFYGRLPPDAQRQARRIRGLTTARIEIGLTQVRQAGGAAMGRIRPHQDGPLLSVVMPVYNVDGYLNQAVHSVLAQNVNLELILVDDGSTDESGRLCDRFAERDPRVRVIHKINAGLGAARNTGIDAARGEFLVFADSDDYVLPGAYAAMLASLRRSNSQLVTANVKRRQGWRLTQAWNQSRSHLSDQYRVTLHSHPDLIFDTVAWNKVFRTDFWRTYVKYFPVGKLYEDMLPMFTAFLAADAIDILSRTVYVWRRRDEQDSITQRLLEPRNINDRLEAVDAIDAMIAQHGLSDSLGTRLADKVLEADLWIYVREIDEDTSSEMIDFIEEAVTQYWPAAPPSSRSALPAERRVCYWLLEQHRGRDVPAFRKWHSTVWPTLPSRRVGDRVLLDVTGCPVPLKGICDENLDMGPVAAGGVRV